MIDLVWGVPSVRGVLSLAFSPLHAARVTHSLVRRYFPEFLPHYISRTIKHYSHNSLGRDPLLNGLTIVKIDAVRSRTYTLPERVKTARRLHCTLPRRSSALSDDSHAAHGSRPA